MSTNWRSCFARLCRMLADDAFKQYGFCLTEPLYLYGERTPAGAYSRVELYRDNEEPEVMELIITEHIPRNLPIDALTGWFTERLTHQPVLPAAELMVAER